MKLMLAFVGIALCVTKITISEKTDVIVETLKFLNHGKDALKLTNNTNVIVVLGNSGSGKSTFTHYAAGDYSKIFSVKPDNEDASDYIVYDGLDPDPNNTSSTGSRTVIPELVIDEKKLPWYDCPGFSDINNISVEITSKYLLKRIIDNTRNLKMIFLVDFQSVNDTSDHSDFDTLLNHATGLIKDVHRYRLSYALVVSKVPSFRLIDQKRVDVTEEAAVNSVADFIKSYRSVLLRKPKSGAKIQLVDVFLKQSSEEKYLKIGIFWRPNEAGSFDKIQKMVEGRESVLRFIRKQANYYIVDRKDFGYPLSDKAESEIIVMSKYINQNISETLLKIDTQILNALKLNVEHIYSLKDRKDLFFTGERCVKEMLQESMNISPKELLVKLLNLVKSMNISVPDEDLNNIGVQQQYMNLLQLISKKAIYTPSKEWVDSLEKSFTYIRNEFHWYSYLVATFDLLSSHTVQRNVTAYNVENLSDWGKLNKLQGLFINEANFWEFVKKQSGFFELLQNIDVNPDRLYDLNEIIRILLKTPIKYDCKGRRLTVKGEIVKLSDLDLAVCGSISSQIDSVQVFALNTFYADVNYKFQDKALLAIVTNKFHVVDAVKIDLTGTNNDEKPEKPKEPGTESRPSGVAGTPGNHGKNGGNFFAFSNELIDGNKLLVNISGGNGGLGQNGSSAYPEKASFTITGDEKFDNISGYHELKRFGEYRKVEPENSTVETANILKLELCKHKQFENQVFSTPYILYARQCCKPDGLAGSGGIGGYFGNFEFIQPTTNERLVPKVSNMRGLPGLNGTNVTPCKTYKRVVYYECYCQLYYYSRDVYAPYYYGKYLDGKYKLGGPLNIPLEIVPQISIDTTCNRPESYTKFNTEGMNSTKSVESLKVAGIITDFKSFVRENLKKSIRLNDLRRTYDAVDSNTKLKQFYNIKDIVYELVTYENQFFGLSEEVDFLPFYESLLRRIEDYAHSNANSTNLQDRKILASLYTTALTKVNSIRSGRYSNLVIDIGLYLDVVKNNIKKLDELGRVKVINEHRDTYFTELNAKIDEANKLIAKDVQPTIKDTFTELEDEMDNVIKDVISIEEDTIKNIREREENIRKLNKNLMLRAILGGLDILARILGHAGPEGKLAGAMISTGTGIGREFIVDPDESPDHTIKIPPGVENIADHLNESLQKRKQRKIDAIEKEVEKLEKELQEEVPKIGGSLDELKKRLDEAKKKEKPDESEIDKIKEDLDTWIQEKTAELNKDSSIEEKKKEKINKFFERTKKTLELIESGIDLYKDIADDYRKIQAVYDAIKKDFDKLKYLRAFEQQIYDELLPSISELHHSLEATRKTLGTKSLVALDVQKWKIKEALTAAKLSLVDSIEGFESEPAVKNCMDKLANSMDMIIKIYDRIQNYQEQTRMINYLTALQTARFRDIKIADPELRSLYNSLEVTIQSNIILMQYENAVSGFKQNVFPFADRYFNDFKLPNELEFNGTISKLITTIVPQLETLSERAKELNSSVINEDDADIFSAHFGVDDDKSMEPFYIWENREFGYEIQQLLEGKSVYFPALVTRGLDVNAVKFNSVGIDLSSINKTVETEVRKILSPALISITHHGNSYYRCGYRFFTIFSPAETISYSYEKRNGIPAVRNGVYDKLMYNHALLSPYALWNIKLTKIDFEKLKPYAKFVDIKLYGQGQYVRQSAKICSTDLAKYYDLDSTISEINNIGEESILQLSHDESQFMELSLIL